MAPLKNPLVPRFAILVIVCAPWLVPRPAFSQPEPVPSAAARFGTGAVEGRVFNAATAVALGKARVTVEGSALETFTDDMGTFRLTGVPAGEVRLTVSYIGLAAQTAAVRVDAGGLVQREFELARPDEGGQTGSGGVVKLSAFNVVADREMSAQAVAMNEQRYAPNVKNVVAFDEYGEQGEETS